MIIGFVIWIVLCAAVATWAERKGRKAIGYLFLSLFLSPLVGAIVVGCVQNKNHKECPYCKTWIIKEATVCKNCGKQLGNRKSTTQNSSLKDTWISKRIIELIAEGRTPNDAKIQAEAEYTVNVLNGNKSSNNTVVETTSSSN